MKVAKIVRDRQTGVLGVGMDRYLARFRMAGGQERMGMGRYSGKADR